VLLTVDASGAGEGQLAVDVSHDGQNIPSHVTADHPGRYRVSFLPNGPGVYQIRVYFAGAEINGKQTTHVFYTVMTCVTHWLGLTSKCFQILGSCAFSGPSDE